MVPDITDYFFSRPDSDQLEAKILDVFCTYCDGTVTKRSLVALLKTANILNITLPKRTVSDCKIAFVKASLIANTRGCYQSGVIAKKFLTYRVFREVLIPCLAERFGCTCNHLLEAFRKVCITYMEKNNTFCLCSYVLFYPVLSHTDSSNYVMSCLFYIM